jgi:cation diffusion facilitator family transporter
MARAPGTDREPAASSAEPVERSSPVDPADRYRSVARGLRMVLYLNLAVAGAKIIFGYLTGTVSILSDGFHSLTDGTSNVVGLVGISLASKPPDRDHPYGHRKYETIAAIGIVVLLVIVIVELVRNAIDHLAHPQAPEVTAASFAVMIATLAVNIAVVRYEKRAGERLNSEILLADAMHTTSDMFTSLAVIATLVGISAGYPVLDPLAAFVVAIFIGRAGYQIARDASSILSDRTVFAEHDIRDVVMSVAGVIDCHHVRTRGSADHVFLDLHIWLEPTLTLEAAHAASHDVKDRLMGRYPQIADAVIHVEPARE